MVSEGPGAEREGKHECVCPNYRRVHECHDTRVYVYEKNDTLLVTCHRQGCC